MVLDLLLWMKRLRCWTHRGKIQWEEAYAGLAAFEKFGNPLPDETLASFDKTRLAFKGPLTTVVGSGLEVLMWHCVSSMICMRMCVLPKVGRELKPVMRMLILSLSAKIPKVFMRVWNII